MDFKTIGIEINGVLTDIVIGNFSNQILVIITQIKKFGPFIRVQSEETVKILENQENVLEIKTLFGVDKCDDHVAVRLIAEGIKTNKPLLFSLQLKDYSPRVLKTLRDILRNTISE